MTLRMPAACLAALVCAAAPPPAATVETLLAEVRAGLAAHRIDRDLARLVRSVNLTEKLDDDVVEQLESEGAGRQTLDELERQQSLSIGLPLPAHPPRLFNPPARPSEAEQSESLEAAQRLALQYSRGLPDFLCTEIMHRYEDSKRTEHWKTVDTLTVAVRYSSQSGEDYQLAAINGKKTHQTLESLGGSTSEGEFGSALQYLFTSSTAARFHWERWANLRGRMVEVFSYSIDEAHSKYHMSFEFDGRGYRLTPAVRGAVYLERGSHRVLRLRIEGDNFPPGFPILRSPSVLDYQEAEIAGQRFLLPSRAVARVVTRKDQTRNVMEFSEYRKFTSDTSITFGKP